MRCGRICCFDDVEMMSCRQASFVFLVGLLFYLTACGGGGGAVPSSTFTLTVNRSGTGNGTVTSSPSGISCGSTCSASFPFGSSVTLFITPDTGSSFAGWSGDPDCSDGQVTMDADETCTANFAPEPDFSLSCNPSSLSATQGGTATSTCTVQSTGGFNSAVNLSCENAPSGVTCTFAPNPVTPPADGSVDSTLTVNVSGSVPAGDYPFQARGDGENKTHTFDLSLTVQQLPAGNTPMTLVQVSDAATRNAVCNDGTPATYYFRRGQGTGNHRWVIHLQGGGMCYSLETCQTRSVSTPWLMTSKGLPSTRMGNGVQSPLPTENPDFFNAHHIYVHYCSSDLWSGDREAAPASGGWHFRGARIVRAVIEDLMNPLITPSPNLADATEVLFSGGSAGGAGVMANLDWVASQFPRATVRGLNDAGWAV
ncbi:MAG: pectin acetylesterase-family hydrolase, partial [bacterium JZ-2024 1]